MMSLLLAVACACQLGAAAPQPLVVRNGGQAQSVPTQRQADGLVTIRADQLADALSASWVSDGGARYHLQIADSRIDLVVGGRFAVAQADTQPLPGVVRLEGGKVYLPLAFVSDALPRLAGGIIYDTDRDELRRFGSAIASRPVPSTTSATRNIRPRVVVVDAGHGGRDRGMTGPIGSARKVYEKDITLAVADELRAALERRGVKVIMTRSTDTLIALDDRGKIANEAKAELFMSIHVNAANPGWKSPGGARGFETYFLAEAKTEDERRVAAMENESIRFETSADVTSDDPLGFIMRDMAQNEHLRESARLAELVQGGMAAMHPGPNRGVKQAGFRVLVTAFMPAVLVEIGFGSNPAESAYMTAQSNQRALAETLATAALKYLEEYDRKVGGPP